MKLRDEKTAHLFAMPLRLCLRNRRPAVEYIRDVYAELLEMGEGARRPGDRSDISSDEEDEMEVRGSVKETSIANGLEKKHAVSFSWATE